MMYTNNRWSETHEVTNWSPEGLTSCPFPGCGGILGGGWMTWQHFRDIHPMGLVKVPKEEKLRWYRRCEMQVDQKYARHQYMKECQVGVERKKQREAVVTLALALWQQFSIHGDVLE